jgi:hypothetical protein
VRSWQTLPGEALPTSAETQALQQGWLCFDLPGRARRDLTFDGERLRYRELLAASGPPLWQEVALEPDAPTPTVVSAGVALPAPTTPTEWRMRQVGAVAWLDGAVAGAMQPWAAVTPVAWGGVVRLPTRSGAVGGVLAALLVHDTDQSGSHDLDDEADVCLLAQALQPLEVPERVWPKSMSPAVVAALRARLAEAGLPVRGLRVARSPTDADGLGGLLLEARLQGELSLPVPTTASAAELPVTAQLAWLGRLAEDLRTTSGHPELGLHLLGERGEREALVARTDAGAWQARIRIGDRWLDDAHADALADAGSWLALTERIARVVGFVPDPPKANSGDCPNESDFRAPTGFAQLDDRQQRQLARHLWQEVAAHQASRPHACRAAMLHVRDAEGRRWRVDGSGLRRQSEPPADRRR